MSIAATSPHATGSTGWLSRAEAWLDDKGKGAWIALLVVSLIVFWPLGLALLAYMIWSKKMTCHSHKLRRHHRRSGGTGNTAFDAYREETLQRLEEEQQNFEAFLKRLRDARDKAEFDQFIEERAAQADSNEADPETKPT
ncbi:MAG: DUF2852 domain-containing protein [Pseudomonadota bacterium]